MKILVSVGVAVIMMFVISGLVTALVVTIAPFFIDGWNKGRSRAKHEALTQNVEISTPKGSYED